MTHASRCSVPSERKILIARERSCICDIARHDGGAMNAFVLHERLAKGCADLGKHGMCRVLLKNNALFPWLLLVPEVAADVTELHHLDAEAYREVCETIRVFSAWMGNVAGIEKVNVAAIGNQVRQLHIHIVGRHSGDIAWPGVIWSCTEKLPYEENAFLLLQQSLRVLL